MSVSDLSTCIGISYVKVFSFDIKDITFASYNKLSIITFLNYEKNKMDDAGPYDAGGIGLRSFCMQQ